MCSLSTTRCLPPSGLPGCSVGIPYPSELCSVSLCPLSNPPTENRASLSFLPQWFWSTRPTFQALFCSRILKEAIHTFLCASSFFSPRFPVPLGFFLKLTTPPPTNPRRQELGCAARSCSVGLPCSSISIFFCNFEFLSALV